MATGQKADEDPLEHRVLADDDASDLEQDGLGRRPRIGRIREGARRSRRRGASASGLGVEVVGSDMQASPDRRCRLGDPERWSRWTTTCREPMSEGQHENARSGPG